MSFSCSFSPEFWLAEGEPYDRSDLALNSKGQPTSVYSAIMLALQDPEQRADLLEAAGLKGQTIIFDDTIAEELLTKATNTDTCTDLRSPVEVWIDPKGDNRVRVYEGDSSADRS